MVPTDGPFKRFAETIRFKTAEQSLTWLADVHSGMAHRLPMSDSKRAIVKIGIPIIAREIQFSSAPARS